MKLVPELIIGWTNAWLCTIPIFLLPYILRRFLKMGTAKRASSIEGFSNRERRWIDYTMAVYYLNLLYSIVVPLNLGSNAFYAGMSIYIIAFIFLVITMVNFMKALPDRLVADGMYSISRNPMYVFTILAYLGVGIAAASWLILLLTIIFSLLQHKVVLAEERMCEAKYGRYYKEYMEKTPRYLLFF